MLTVEGALYCARIVLRAAGPVLATLGVTDGEMWVTIIGVGLSAIGEAWGIYKTRKLAAG